MRSLGIAVVLLVGASMLLGVAGTIGGVAAAGDGTEKVTLLDDCDPTDATWTPTGGCTLREGDVTRAEFNAFSIPPPPLAAAVIGHLAWRIDPGYLKIESDDKIKVRNDGGRSHTFTKVAAFGGGRVPPLNFGLIQAPECTNPAIVGPTVLPPGARLEVTGLSAGDHRFQCCFHPWMRAHVKVEPED